LIMFGTPNTGTEIARVAPFSTSGDQMRPFTEFLEELNPTDHLS
jgi:hypothetical protein